MMINDDDDKCSISNGIDDRFSDFMVDSISDDDDDDYVLLVMMSRMMMIWS